MRKRDKIFLVLLAFAASATWLWAQSTAVTALTCNGSISFFNGGSIYSLSSGSMTIDPTGTEAVNVNIGPTGNGNLTAGYLNLMGTYPSVGLQVSNILDGNGILVGVLNKGLTVTGLTNTGSVKFSGIPGGAGYFAALDASGNMTAAIPSGGGGGSIFYGPNLITNANGQIALNTNVSLLGNLTSPSNIIVAAAGSASGSIILTNTQPASAGLQSNSPSLYFAANGWKTTATAASENVVFSLNAVAIQGTSAPSGTFFISNSINGGAWSQVFSLSSSGNGSFSGTASAATFIAGQGISTSSTLVLSPTANAWSTTVASLNAGYTNVLGTNMVANVQGSSGSIIFWNRGTAGGVAVNPLWTNTIIASGESFPLGQSCGFQITSGVGVYAQVYAP